MPSGEFFCANAHCRLHVRVGDADVHGSGHWAELAEGIIVSHSLHQGSFWCDLCLRRAAHADTRRVMIA
jgi:hypothetical protein